MARAVTTALNNELTAASLSPFLAVRLDIKDDPILTWTGLGTITIDSEQYIGTQNLLNIQPAAESGALEANGVAITLSGIPVSLIAIALAEVYQGRSAKIFIGALDSVGAVVSSPYELFSGFMDTMVIADEAETASHSITLENRLVDFERARVRRYTSEDQKIDFPNDKGLEFVADLQEKEILWGR